MTEKQMADIPFEGNQDFNEGSEEETSEDSQSEEKTDEDDTQSDHGDNTGQEEEDEGEENNEEDDDSQVEKNVPFHKHPRWKKREQEWQEKFNNQEKRHQDDIKAIREEFGSARKENAEQVEIPSWFGGDQEQWNAYRRDQDKIIKQAEERAVQRLKEEKDFESKAVKEATEYMQNEIAEIEQDEKLNPDGKKIDPNKLVRIVMDNDLIDSKGRWNYRAGMKIYNATRSKQSNIGDRKQIAAATTSKSKGEATPNKPFKTSDDFKNERPW